MVSFRAELGDPRRAIGMQIPTEHMTVRRSATTGITGSEGGYALNAPDF